MTKISKLMGYICLLLITYHFGALIYYGIKFNMEKDFSFSLEGSLSEQISLIHLVLLFFVIIYFLFLKNQGWIDKAIRLASSLFMVGIYYFWYVEKYWFLQTTYGLREGTADYEVWMSEFGLFRGGTWMDPIALGLALLLTAYSIFRFFLPLLPKSAR